jgi:hypothetical protein
MDGLDWAFLGILIAMGLVAGGEFLAGAKQLAVSTLLWVVVLACFFAASLYVRVH